MSLNETLRPEGRIRDFYGSEKKRKALMGMHPGLHNLVGFEKGWKEAGALQDFLDPASPLYHTKRISTLLYDRFIEPILSRVPESGRVLDAGCGIGRFTLSLCKRFERVVAFDPCRSSISACKRHLIRAGCSNVEVHWADLSWLEELEADSFDLILAMELICYTEDPAKALEALTRVAKPGGVICLSVEGRPGALASQSVSDMEKISKALRGEPLFVPEDRFVVFFSEKEVSEMMADRGMQDIRVEGSHYLIEGPFWNMLDDSGLAKHSYAEKVLEMEKQFAANPLTAPMARVFSAVGKIPAPSTHGHK